MEILEISEKRFKKLKPLELSNHICNTESKLYHYIDKVSWNKKSDLIKRFYVTTGESFGNKLYNINTLIDNKELIGIDSLVIPEKMVSVNGSLVGYVMPYIESKDFNAVMIKNVMDVKKKIYYLKQIGVMLEKLKKTRKYTLKDKFFLGDLHGNNFIIDNNDKVLAVDLDSCYIKNGNPFPSKMLCESSTIKNLPRKYKMGVTYIIPNENSDLYCYIMMIINTFSGIDMHEKDTGTFYSYLEYLMDFGFDKELLDIFSLVYEKKDNINPYEYLDTIPEHAYRAHINCYKLKRK